MSTDLGPERAVIYAWATKQAEIAFPVGALDGPQAHLKTALIRAYLANHLFNAVVRGNENPIQQQIDEIAKHIK